jgi:hypothetical protein
MQPISSQQQAKLTAPIPNTPDALEIATDRLNTIHKLPADQRKPYLESLITELVVLSPKDKNYLHTRIAMAMLSLPTRHAETLQTPLLRSFAATIKTKTADEIDDDACQFAETLFLGSSARDSEFKLRLCIRMIGSAQDLGSKRLLAKCLSVMQASLTSEKPQQLALLIGQAISVIPALLPELRLGVMHRMYEVAPREIEARCVALRAIQAQAEYLPDEISCKDFNRSLLQELYQLQIAAASSQMTEPMKIVLTSRLPLDKKS